jgi:serine/threonine-protein kinase RsbW
VSNELKFTVRARWDSIVAVRRRVWGWLHTHGWPPDDSDDLVFAVNEAVSNSIEHGYLVGPDQHDHPGTVEIHGQVRITPQGRGRSAMITVRDFGAWRHHRAGIGIRRRGLDLMRATTASMTVQTGSDGTTVVLSSRVCY